MLSKCVNINLGSPTGNPLETAALARDVENISAAMQQARFCIAPGARTQGSGALRNAAYGGRVNLVRYLHSHGADIDDVDEHNNHKSSLTEASSRGHTDVVDFLLKHGGDTKY
ncbi:MAG: hypothetical protein M1830_010624 [Pleopsidium flavum]|nr:MAG: hypothetical protein M1830_010624 [Pleopsidium flavum]